jgi:hypothetical protein
VGIMGRTRWAVKQEGAPTKACDACGKRCNQQVCPVPWLTMFVIPALLKSAAYSSLTQELSLHQVVVPNGPAG